MPGREFHVDVLAWAANYRGCKAMRAVELKAVRRLCTIAGSCIDEEAEQGHTLEWNRGGNKELFPEEMTKGMEIPVRSDLCMEPPFTLYRESVKGKGMDYKGSLPPRITADLEKGARGTAKRLQKGRLLIE